MEEQEEMERHSTYLAVAGKEDVYGISSTVE